MTCRCGAKRCRGTLLLKVPAKAKARARQR
jgi:hypothetical protein